MFLIKLRWPKTKSLYDTVFRVCEKLIERISTRVATCGKKKKNGLVPTPHVATPCKKAGIIKVP